MCVFDVNKIVIIHVNFRATLKNVIMGIPILQNYTSNKYYISII